MLEVENGDVMDGDARLPWATGPGEILRHGLELLKKDTDTNRRLAMILIDNAVELMIKTYLGLPRRVTGLAISRGEYQRFSESFPKLLDALEEYADDKLNGIDLGEIEWYHRIRNQLYHQGNGLTVERGKVEVYAELANVLFSNLFGSRLVEPEEDVNALLGDFMLAWIDFERLLFRAAQLLAIDTSGRPISAMQVVRALESGGLISQAEMTEIHQLQQLRNEVVHGVRSHKDTLSPQVMHRLVSLAAGLENRLRQPHTARCTRDGC